MWVLQVAKGEGRVCVASAGAKGEGRVCVKTVSLDSPQAVTYWVTIQGLIVTNI